jgi:hypothetical protein
MGMIGKPALARAPTAADSPAAVARRPAPLAFAPPAPGARWSIGALAAPRSRATSAGAALQSVNIRQAEIPTADVQDNDPVEQPAAPQGSADAGPPSSGSRLCNIFDWACRTAVGKLVVVHSSREWVRHAQQPELTLTRDASGSIGGGRNVRHDRDWPLHCDNRRRRSDPRARPSRASPEVTGWV